MTAGTLEEGWMVGWMVGCVVWRHWRTLEEAGGIGEDPVRG